MKVLHHPVLQNHRVPVQVLPVQVLPVQVLPVQVLPVQVLPVQVLLPGHLHQIDHQVLIGYLPDTKVNHENRKLHHPVMNAKVRQPIVAKAKGHQDEADMTVHPAMKARALLEDRVKVLPHHREILIHQDQPDKVIHHNNQIIVQIDGKMEPNQKILFAHH